MNNLIAIAIVLVGQYYVTPIASAEPVTKDVVVSVHDVFVPDRVEQGTEAKVIVSGMFPNSCYRWARAEVAESTPTLRLVQAHATVTQTMCLMVLVPFSKEVNLGRLPSGTHTLRFVNGDETYFERTLIVQ